MRTNRPNAAGLDDIMEHKINGEPHWVTTKLAREELHGKSVAFKDDAGHEILGKLEVEKVNAQGQMIIRVCYIPGAHSGTIMLTAFRMTQEQADSLKKDGSSFTLDA
jgi:hypothetical protein